MNGSPPVPVLYCIDSLPATGGTEGQLAGLLERLDRRRFQPHLCTLRPEVPLRPLPADCSHLSLSVHKLLGAGALRAGRQLAGYLRSHGVGVVQTFFQDATVFGLWTARLAGVPVRLGSFRDLGFWRSPRVEFLMRRTYPLATGFVVNSVAVRDHFTRADGLDTARFHLIANGLDTGSVAFHPEYAEPLRVILVGNLNRAVKRADLFLRAAARVAQRHPEVRWQVVGDGDLRPGLEDLARELGLDERVEFLGRRSDVADLLAEAAISVNCSDSEGFSNAVLESMLAGCAVVGTDNGGNGDLITHGETGMLVPTGDAEALATAIGGLIDAPDQRRRLIQRARQHVAAEFDWERAVAAHQDLYARLLTRS